MGRPSGKRIQLFIILLLLLVSIGVFAQEPKDNKNRNQRGKEDQPHFLQDKNLQELQKKENNSNRDEHVPRQEQRATGDQRKLQKQIMDCAQIINQTENRSKEILKNLHSLIHNPDKLEGELNKIKKELNEAVQAANLFFDDLTLEEQQKIEAQKKAMIEALNYIEKQWSIQEKEIHKEKPDEKKISSLNKELQKEINKIYRQFRAINWILFEKE